MAKLKTVDLVLPAATEELAKLELGNVVYLTGRVHTAREGVYKRAVEERSNVPSGIGTASFHCSPAASVGPNRELTVGVINVPSFYQDFEAKSAGEKDYRSTTRDVRKLIDELKENFTIVIVTHSMQQAARVSQRTAMFHLGKLVEEGETGTMFTNPREKKTQDYITGRYG